MRETDIILARMPQADGRVKKRPALILREMPSQRDLLVCGISTQLHRCIRGFDEIVSPSDVDFASSRLVAASLIRLGFLAILDRKEVIGRIGSIAPERHARLLQALSNYLVRRLQPTRR